MKSSPNRTDDLYRSNGIDRKGEGGYNLGAVNGILYVLRTLADLLATADPAPHAAVILMVVLEAIAGAVAMPRVALPSMGADVDPAAARADAVARARYRERRADYWYRRRRRLVLAVVALVALVVVANVSGSAGVERAGVLALLAGLVLQTVATIGKGDAALARALELVRPHLARALNTDDDLGSR